MTSDLFQLYSRAYESRREAEMSLSEYIEGCRRDPLMFAGAHERLLAAIGEPEMIDTSKDARLGRIFMNRTVRIYPTFSEFYGMEETIERIVAFFRHGAQGLSTCSGRWAAANPPSPSASSSSWSSSRSMS
jgi:serine protein kinase